MIKAYTDGACRGNPGPGGWGVLLSNDIREKEIYGGKLVTTNNQMELQACIEALRALKRPSEIMIITDSRYVINGCEIWMTNWKANGWRTAKGGAVANLSMWIELDRLLQTHKVTFQWVKGHSNDIYNDRADALANLGCDAAIKGL